MCVLKLKGLIYDGFRRFNLLVFGRKAVVETRLIFPSEWTGETFFDELNRVLQYDFHCILCCITVPDRRRIQNAYRKSKSAFRNLQTSSHRG